MDSVQFIYFTWIQFSPFIFKFEEKHFYFPFIFLSISLAPSVIMFCSHAIPF